MLEETVRMYLFLMFAFCMPLIFLFEAVAAADFDYCKKKSAFCFSDVVHPDFKLIFDVYSCLLDPAFIPFENGAGSSNSGSIRFKRKLKGSLRRSFGSKFGALIVSSV